MLSDNELFNDTLQGLHNGDFSRLEPRFVAADETECAFVRWHRQGRFQYDPKAVAEAFSCACFLGINDVAKYLLKRGVDPAAGANTGLDAFHWAVNRGQLETVRLLLNIGLPLEERNSHGTTLLGTAVWSAIYEPKAAHMEIIAELLNAGALVDNVEYPTGNQQIDELIRQHLGD